MLLNYLTILSITVTLVFSYNIRMFTLTGYENISESQCGINNGVHDVRRLKVFRPGENSASTAGNGLQSYSFVTISVGTPKPTDPLMSFERIFHQILYGRKSGLGGDVLLCTPATRQSDVIGRKPFAIKLGAASENFTGKRGSLITKINRSVRYNCLDLFQPDPRMLSAKVKPDTDYLAHWPTGQVMRAEIFQNKSSVHLPFLEYMHRGHCHLKVTKDYMQTAVDAFAIFISGDLADVERLPSAYVLHSARTIAMMRIAREKLAATWYVVKGSTPTDAVTYETLEKFRPLFKYINGREMARLNLSDNKILSYIGTHPDLNRHQVGVVASKYIQLNPHWTDAKYLNMMNNLLCGVPMIFMRRIPENTYLQLTHQLFYHIRACDPLQRRFYLAMMMRTQALGKSYSWSAREVSRLGLLLAEVNGQDLSAINPEAMAGITSQVMLEMPIHSLKSITEMQLRYLEPKPLNILARKLIAFQNQKLSATSSGDTTYSSTVVSLIFFSYMRMS